MLGKFSQTNLTAASRDGTVVTASATPHASGAWTVLIASTAAAVTGIYIVIDRVSASATDARALLDLAYGDETTGGNEVAIWSSLNCGNARDSGNVAYMLGGASYYMPCAVAASKSISARLQAVVSEETCRVRIFLETAPLNAATIGAITTYGAVTAASQGTAVTQGNGAFGNWTEIGTTSAAHNCWTIGFDLDEDTVANSVTTLVEIGYGPDSGTVTSIGYVMVGEDGVEALTAPFPQNWYAAVATSTKLWVRLAAGSNPGNYGVILYGVNVTLAGSGGSKLVGPGALVQ